MVNNLAYPTAHTRLSASSNSYEIGKISIFSFILHKFRDDGSSFQNWEDTSAFLACAPARPAALLSSPDLNTNHPAPLLHVSSTIQCILKLEIENVQMRPI